MQRYPSAQGIHARQKTATLTMPASTPIHELLKAKRDDILRIATAHGAHNVRVFGSVARGDAKPTSDVDFLVELEEGRSLLDHVALIQALENLLGRKVDVVTDGAVHWYIRDRVLAEAVPL